MIDALYIAESGLNAKQKQLDSIAHNIANVSTPGYKSSQVNFLTVVQEQRDENGQLIASSGLGVKSSQPALDMSSGQMEQTGRAMDVAINGAGFIEVEVSDNQRAYSRGGRLLVDEQGYMKTDSGYRLSSMIQVPPDVSELIIDTSGLVSAKLEQGQTVQLGDIQLVNFSDTSEVNLMGENLYEASGASLNSIYFSRPGESGMGAIQQGMLEASNVSMNQEMMNMMLAQRSYQLNARLVQVSDQILETLNNLRR